MKCQAALQELWLLTVTLFPEQKFTEVIISLKPQHFFLNKNNASHFDDVNLLIRSKTSPYEQLHMIFNSVEIAISVVTIKTIMC